MADPLIPASTGDIVEKVGLAIATIIGLVYVLKWLSQAHLAALNGRITTLEGELVKKDALIAAREQKIDQQQQDHMATVITHAHDMKSLVMQLLANDKANRDFMREHHQVVIGLFDKLGSRPCMLPDYQPHAQSYPPVQPRPNLPSVPETDSTVGRA